MFNSNLVKFYHSCELKCLVRISGGGWVATQSLPTPDVHSSYPIIYIEHIPTSKNYHPKLILSASVCNTIHQALSG